MPYSTPKKSVKEVRYLNKDFTSFKSNLIEFAKIYFPNQYNDFNESSPGMMFIEMASYVGDVLSYYVDNQFKESLQQAAFALDDYTKGMRTMKSNLINPQPKNMTDDRIYF